MLCSVCSWKRVVKYRSIIQDKRREGKSENGNLNFLVAQRSTERSVWEVNTPASYQEVSGPTLDAETGCPDRGHLWFSSDFPGKFLDKTLHLATAASLHILSIYY
jgi:hypothetical protein